MTVWMSPNVSVKVPENLAYSASFCYFYVELPTAVGESGNRSEVNIASSEPMSQTKGGIMGINANTARVW